MDYLLIITQTMRICRLISDIKARPPVLDKRLREEFNIHIADYERDILENIDKFTSHFDAWEHLRMVLINISDLVKEVLAKVEIPKHRLLLSILIQQIEALVEIHATIGMNIIEPCSKSTDDLSSDMSIKTFRKAKWPTAVSVKLEEEEEVLKKKPKMDASSDC